MTAESPRPGILLSNLLQSGTKTNAKMIPEIIDNKIGLIKKKDKTNKTAKITVEVVFFQKDFSCLSPMFILTKIT